MRRRLLAALLAMGLLGASGCSSGAAGPALSDTAARQLQADVLAVTQSTAAQNWTVARANLDKLTSDLAAARTAGTVSPARAASIQAAIVAVSADIAAASAQSTPTAPVKTTPAPKSSHPAPSPTRHKKHGGDGGD